MKTFQDFIFEMADESGVHDLSSFNKRSDWNKFYKGKNSPYMDKIGSNHYKIYKIYSTFYLTSVDDEYLGSIEVKSINNVGQISGSNSILERGFYNIMFTSLLSKNLVEILSDTNLSTNAINSYTKLNVNSKLLIRIKNLNTSDYYPFDNALLKSKPYFVVSVSDKNINEMGYSLSDHFKMYSTRINNEYKTMFENNNIGLDHYLFGENFIGNEYTKYEEII